MIVPKNGKIVNNSGTLPKSGAALDLYHFSVLEDYAHVGNRHNHHPRLDVEEPL